MYRSVKEKRTKHLHLGKWILGKAPKLYYVKLGGFPLILMFCVLKENYNLTLYLFVMEDSDIYFIKIEYFGHEICQSF